MSATQTRLPLGEATALASELVALILLDLAVLALCAAVLERSKSLGVETVNRRYAWQGGELVTAS